MRTYEYFCLAALLVLFLTLWDMGFGAFSFLPIMVGGASIVGRWRLSAALMVMLIILMLTNNRVVDRLVGHPVRVPTGLFELTDLLISGSMLAFIAGQYRLQMLAQGGPGETVKRRYPVQGVPVPAAPVREVATAEIIMLLVSMAAFVVLGQVLWDLLPPPWDPLHLRKATWRTVLLGWSIAAGILVVAGLIGVIYRKSLRPEEAALFLQDLLWHDIRREQRRITRWLVTDLLRKRRRKQA